MKEELFSPLKTCLVEIPCNKPGNKLYKDRGLSYRFFYQQLAKGRDLTRSHHPCFITWGIRHTPQPQVLCLHIQDRMSSGVCWHGRFLPDVSAQSFFPTASAARRLKDALFQLSHIFHSLTLQLHTWMTQSAEKNAAVFSVVDVNVWEQLSQKAKAYVPPRAESGGECVIQ